MAKKINTARRFSGPMRKNKPHCQCGERNWGVVQRNLCDRCRKVRDAH